MNDELLSIHLETLTYQPNQNTHGPDSFTFQATDGELSSNTATVHLSVAAVNDDSVAGALDVTTAEDTAYTGQVIATDVDGEPLDYAVVDHPSPGTLILQTDGSFEFAPSPDYHGSDNFGPPVGSRDGLCRVK